MVLFVEKRRGIVLSVNINQLNSQLMENRNRHKTPVDTADIFPVQKNLPLDYRLRVIVHPVFRKPAQLRNLGENTPDGSLLGAGSDHIPVGPFSNNGGNGINYNGFARAGLAGEDVESPVKRDIRLLNDSNIFNVQQTQHGASSFCQLISALISPQKTAAELASRKMATTVSSPAKVPRIYSAFMASRAEAAALARPGRV